MGCASSTEADDDRQGHRTTYVVSAADKEPDQQSPAAKATSPTAKDRRRSSAGAADAVTTPKEQAAAAPAPARTPLPTAGEFGARRASNGQVPLARSNSGTTAAGPPPAPPAASAPAKNPDAAPPSPPSVPVNDAASDGAAQSRPRGASQRSGTGSNGRGPVITIARFQPAGLPPHATDSPASSSNQYGPHPSTGPSTPDERDTGRDQGQPYGRFSVGPTREPDPLLVHAVWSLKDTLGTELPMPDFVGSTPPQASLEQRGCSTNSGPYVPG